MDPSQNNDPEVFHLGLCMAGAVSAGAYTAGVIDYLLEALNEWEKRRGQPGVPNHKVQIPVMGGASAGGMTSVMTATALNNPLTPIDKPTSDLLAEHPENKLYHSWVDLTGVDMFSKMLDTSDIKPGEVISGLNSSFIKPIADRVVSCNPAQWQPLPAYIPQGLKIFTTLSNLQGFPYKAPFGGGNKSYNMVVHNDYACFELTEKKITGANNGWIPLNIKDNINTDIAANAAMATGAFPVGLEARTVTRDPIYLTANKWLKNYLENTPLPKDKPYTTLNVDGGLINNEPFDRVRDVLDDITHQSIEDTNNPNKFTSTVLMIEPFPTKTPKPISLSQNLGNVIGLTLSTMISQMRSKPIEIKNAVDEDCFAQYLITPSRLVTGPDGKTEELSGELAIACGALSGFSGFLNKEFRVHDYFLGRFNCKIFLRDYFTVTADALENNPIFKNGYAGCDPEQFKSQKDDKRYQIIPVFADATDYTFPDFKFKSGSNWPILQDSDIDQFQDKLKKRTQAVILNLAKFDWFTRKMIWIGTWAILDKLIANKIIAAIKSELQAWKLLPIPSEKNNK